MNNVIEDITCAGCCCVCDDIQLTTDGQQILEVQIACPQGQAWFQQSSQTEALSPLIKGIVASHIDAVASAIDLIQTAKSPLIYGMAQSSVDGQRAAVALADQIGATIDTSASAANGALQQVGEAPCTLGEVRSRADLIIYWGADELLANERHRQSISSEKQGVARTIVLLGAADSPAAGFTDKVIPLEPERELETIWSLRALLKGVDVDLSQPMGISESALQELVELIQQSQYSVFFYGPEFKQGPLAHRKIEALSLLIQETQAERRCHGIGVPRAGETKGAENVLAWQTGYAATVNFASGYPRSSPGEFSANELLEQGECDLCILVGTNSLSGLSEGARQRLSQIPVILIGPASEEIPDLQVFLPTGITGIHFPGSIYRFDGTPLPLRGYVATERPSEADVLSELVSLLP